jgi:hypothetical protein
MTQRCSPAHAHAEPRPLVRVVRLIDQNPDHHPDRRTAAGVLLVALFSILPTSLAIAETAVSPMLLTDVIQQQANQLSEIDSDERAQKLFTTTVGPALGLRDAAGALGARLPSTMVKELGLTSLSQSAYKLMAALATWQFADSILRDTSTPSVLPSLSVARQDWLRSRNQAASLADLLRLVQEDYAERTAQATSPRNTELLLVAARTVFESSQLATAAWWDMYSWKERIRQAKGRARLCGAWQWITHNHQVHGEQKSTVIFPPPGEIAANVATPVETIVLGNAIYLRWEHNGHIQEDSLLFIKDDAKIEGSFMNNSGGWGPITAKRTAPCRS